MTDIIILIWLHFLCDFVIQTDKIAKAKSSSNRALTIHCILYTLPFFYFGWLYAVINFVAHFITDFLSSRLAGYYYRNGERHKFFIVIGFDQAIHLTTLILTLKLI